MKKMKKVGGKAVNPFEDCRIARKLLSSGTWGSSSVKEIDNPTH